MYMYICGKLNWEYRCYYMRNRCLDNSINRSISLKYVKGCKMTLIFICSFWTCYITVIYYILYIYFHFFFVFDTRFIMLKLVKKCD